MYEDVDLRILLAPARHCQLYQQSWNLDPDWHPLQTHEHLTSIVCKTLVNRTVILNVLYALFYLVLSVLDLTNFQSFWFNFSFFYFDETFPVGWGGSSPKNYLIMLFIFHFLKFSFPPFWSYRSSIDSSPKQCYHVDPEYRG